MKKKSIILFLLTICMLSTGCYQMKKDINDNTNIKINVNVNSVDQGIIQGRYVCQNENMLAYRDGAGIYLSKDGNEAKKVAVISGLEGISVNSKYVFYLRKDGGIYAIDNNEKDIIKDTTGWGSENIDKPIELLDDINTSEVFNSIGDNIYVYKGDYEDLKVWEIGTGEVKEVEGFEYKNKYVLNDENNTYLYNYDRSDIEFLDGEKIIQISFEGIELSYKEVDGNEGKIYLEEFQNDTRRGMVSSAAHVAADDNKIYVLIQKCHPAEIEVNQEAKFIEGNYLAVYDLDDKTSKILYSTRKNDPSEQICGFSARKNQLFLLDNGKLYVADLEGNNKKEIADVSKYNSLNFEYAADKLWVYRDSTLVMTY